MTCVVRAEDSKHSSPLEVSGTFKGSSAASASDETPWSAAGFVMAAAEAAPAGVYDSGTVGTGVDAIDTPGAPTWRSPLTAV